MKKKTRRHAIQDDNLILFVQEDQNCVQQLDTQLNKHVDEPTSRPCQWAPAHCSGCGIVRHTIRNCPSK